MQTRHVLTSCRHCLRWRNNRQNRHTKCSPVADPVSEEEKGVTEKCSHAPCSPVADTLSDKRVADNADTSRTHLLHTLSPDEREADNAATPSAHLLQVLSQKKDVADKPSTACCRQQIPSYTKELADNADTLSTHLLQTLSPMKE